MLEILSASPIFRGMSEEEIQKSLDMAEAKSISVKKDSFIFSQGDMPKYLMILIKGSVAICTDSTCGKRSILAVFDTPGELFGEVFVFLNKTVYEQYAQALTDAEVLYIPKKFLVAETGDIYHQKIMSNLLQIFARKTYYLNKRVQILSSAGLRQKIAKLLLQNYTGEDKIDIGMNREELADFLNVARPSLSRELMKMQDDGLITADKTAIYIEDLEALEELL